MRQVNKSLRLTANAIQNYSFEKSEKIPTDLADEKDSGISQVAAGADSIRVASVSSSAPDLP